MTEIYVSLDGLQYNKIDMDNGESIVMKYILKDLQDISKVFSPFSQTFSFKATPSNQRALRFFGDTTVVRASDGNRYRCKIYTDGVLNLTGILQVKEGRYVDGQLSTYNAEFGTFMTNLKDRIGSDKITSLGSFVIDYGADKISPYMQGTHNGYIDDVEVKWFIPFMSNNRVWAFSTDTGSGLDDNICWRSSTNHNSDKFINDREVRPSLTMLSIVKLIEQKYGLFITAPIQNRAELKEAYVWCNNEIMQNVGWYPFKMLNNTVNFSSSFVIGSPVKYVLTSHNSTNSIRITRNPAASANYETKGTFIFKIENKFSDRYLDSSGRLRLRRKDTNEILYTEDFTTTSGKSKFTIVIPDSMFVSNICEFVVETSWDNNVIHERAEYAFNFTYNISSSFSGSGSYKGGILGLGFNYSGNSNTSYNKRSIDLIKSLPEIDVIEFLTSYLKTFNVQIFDTSPNNDRLFFLTPSDINTSGLEYSKATLDYTPYVDIKAYNKKTSNDYNYYNFKHQDSNYRSNIDYKKAAGIDYGQLIYPSIIPANPNEFKIETSFSIIPPVNVANTNSILTTYGFNSDNPELNSFENLVYTPNYNELTLMYKPEPMPLPAFIAVTSCLSNGIPTIEKMPNYIPALPFNSVGNSLSFSVLVINSVSYNDTLYSRGYSAQIERLLDPNCLTQSFTLSLPSNEIYLNEETSVQDGGDTPSGFRLQNDIIIGEDKFTIVDASIDVTSGKTQLTLLNYT